MSLSWKDTLKQVRAHAIGFTAGTCKLGLGFALQLLTFDNLFEDRMSFVNNLRLKPSLIN
jgi:hypothetical protein